MGHICESAETISAMGETSTECREVVSI
eukprot:SAG31_NODE_11765_length_1000_cov_0.916759_1_plen_27_part_10